MAALQRAPSASLVRNIWARLDRFVAMTEADRGLLGAIISKEANKVLP
jgi:hypothetical protein